MIFVLGFELAQENTYDYAIKEIRVLMEIFHEGQNLDIWKMYLGVVKYSSVLCLSRSCQYPYANMNTDPKILEITNFSNKC